MQGTNTQPQNGSVCAVTLGGTVVQVLQEKPENGEVVLLVDTSEGTLRASGAVPFAMPGECLVMQGQWMEPGQPFRIMDVRRHLPDTVEAVQRFLAETVLRTLGSVPLQRMLDRYGGEALRILIEDPLRLSEIPGLPADRALAASDELHRRLSCQETAQWLVSLGLSPLKADILVKRHGMQVMAVLRENPYRLADPGLGLLFVEADRAALRSGVSRTDPRRLAAGAEWLLRQAEMEGHVCLPEPELLTQLFALLHEGVPGNQPEQREQPEQPEQSEPEQLENKLSAVAAFDDSFDAGWSAIDHTTFLARHREQMQAWPESFMPPERTPAFSICLVYTPDRLHLEERAAQRLQALRTVEEHRRFQLGPADWTALESLAPWGWDDGQRKVFEDAGSHGVTVVTGGPGTGKTTLLKGLVRLFQDREMEVVLTAPTGRAARRMSDATGVEARTVHRLLEVAYDVEGDAQLRFRRNAMEPLEADVILLDEASMLDLPLFAALLDACADGTRLILIGDAAQLPSVGAGRVLGDLIDSRAIPVTCLGQIFRQNDGSRIAENARKILAGDFPEFSDEWGDFHLVRRYRGEQIAEAVVRLCQDELPERYGVDPLIDIQVLSPMRKGAAGTARLNQLLREALNPGKGKTGSGQEKAGDGPVKPVRGKTGPSWAAFREGDRVMQNRNAYRQPWVWQEDGQRSVPGEGVYNGDMGTLMELDVRTRTAVVLFDDGREARYEVSQMDGLEPAYAVTVHKSQGSEYPVVVLALGGLPDSLACRNLLYTAITRARKMVVIVGNEAILARMIANNRNLMRYSGLALRLRALEVGRPETYKVPEGKQPDVNGEPEGGLPDVNRQS